jgi:transcriptional regulator with XRE-family HTH domain
MEQKSYSPFFVGGNFMIANRLREARVVKRITQFDLRIKTGFSQTMISYWERGLLQPREDQKKKLASALGMNIREVFPQEKGDM